MYRYGKTQLHPKLLLSFPLRFRSNKYFSVKKSVVHTDTVGGSEKNNSQIVFFVALLLVGVLIYEQFTCCSLGCWKVQVYFRVLFLGCAERLCHNTAA